MASAARVTRLGPDSAPQPGGTEDSHWAGAAGTVITLQDQAHAADVRALMRKAGVIPLTAAVTPGSALLRSIAGEPAAQVMLPAVWPAAIVAVPAVGPGAAAMSAGFRRRRPAEGPATVRSCKGFCPNGPLLRPAGG